MHTYEHGHQITYGIFKHIGLSRLGPGGDHISKFACHTIC